MKFKIVKSQRKTFFVAIFFVMYFGVLQAQQTITVKGVVTGGEDALPGVSIIEKGTSNGVVTDFNGNYNIKVNSNSTLIFSSIGFALKEVKVNGKKTINVNLSEDISQLDEIVIIGYGSQKKKELTGAVAQVKAESLERISTPDLGTALQGQIAGVNVTASSGQPGADSQILIRGVNSVFGSNEPLYIVDGIPQDGNPQLSIAEIETIDVLKDAASAAIYGTRGSAGVILITTKTGEVGKMNIRLTSYYGVQDIISDVPLLDFEGFWYQEFTKLNAIGGTFVDNSFTRLEQNRFNFTNNTSLMNILQNDLAPIQNHTLNVSGGKQGLTYNVSVNYFDQVGSLINSRLERLNIRLNTKYKKDKWTIITGVGLKTDKQQYTPYQILFDGYRYKPFQIEIDPNETDNLNGSGTNTSNPAQNLSFFVGKLRQTDVRDGDVFNFRTEVNYRATKDLRFTTRVSMNRRNDTRVRVNRTFEAFDVQGNLIPEAIRSGVRNQSDRFTAGTIDGIVNYTKELGNHKISLMAAYSAEKYTHTSFFAQRFDLLSNEITNLNGTTLDPNVGTGSGFFQDRTNTLIGMLGRVQYNYKGMYLLSASLRRDGTSRFSADNRWIYAPSASAAVVVSDIKNWDEIFGNTFNFLKFRLSYGTTGNQSIRDYSTQPTIGLGHDYIFGSSANQELVLGAIQEAYSNPGAKWEKKVEKNFGVDLGFFKNKLTITSELYDGSRTNMLFPVILPPTAGAGGNSTVILNVGDMRNYGMELSANYKNRKGAFKYNVGATFSQNRNEITRMSDSNKFSFLAGSEATTPNDPNEDPTKALREGYEAGAFFLVETNGVIKNEADLLEYQQFDPTAKLGDLRYVDQLTEDTNGDGVPDAGNGTIDLDDRVYKGSALPDFEIGFNFNTSYKNFDLSMNWYAAVGQEIINGSKAFTYKQGSHRDQIYQWSPANPTSDIPVNRGIEHPNFRGFTDFWLEDGSFARLKNVTLGYSLPKKLTKKLNIQKLRFYIAADNIITITGYDGFNPEVGNSGLNTQGIDSGTYPLSAQYRAGIEFRF